jgi:hypothetical protein
MKGRKIKSKKGEISLLAKAIKSIKDNKDSELDSLTNEIIQKALDKNIKRNSSLKILPYDEKKFFPDHERNSKNNKQ